VNRYVIDASVAAKWFLPRHQEPLAGEAIDLIAQYAADEIQLLVPDLFWAELGNLLWNAVRRRRCSQGTADAALATTKGYKLSTVATEKLIDQAFAIAVSFDRSVYDSIYVALAIESKSQLVTADEKLAGALAAHMPIKWLGAF
jgi:predicted nucleic acid-binding protein